tara:strand:- start:22729 stop:24234 length:1506 start_codon:yes stop_codon:yes gene_type:complete
MVNIPNIPIPNAPTIPSIPSLPKLPALGGGVDPTAAFADFQNKLAESGQDATLLDIKAKLQEKAGDIGNTDFAGLSPADLASKLDEASAAIEGSISSMLDKAKQLEIPKISLQEEMGKILTGVSADVSGLTSKLASAKFPPGLEIPDVGKIAADVGAALPTPDLGGLNAGLAGLADKAAGLLKGNTPSLPFGGGMSLDIGIGAPSGFDPAKLIPNIKLEERKIFDEDGAEIGTEIVATLEGKPATAPVIDEADESAIPDYIPTDPVPVTKNPFLKLEAALVGAGRQAFSKFKLPVTTKVEFDPATGENIVFEASVDESGAETFTASGFDTPEAFEQKFNEGRKAALAKVKEASGAARQLLAEGTNAMQETFKALGSIVGSPPKPEAPEGIISDAKKKIIRDPVTGIVINTSQMEAISGQLAAKTKQIDASVGSFFNRLGHPLTEDQKLGNFPADITSDGVFSDEEEDPFKDAPETTPEEFNKKMKALELPIRFTGGGFGTK